MVKKYGYTFLLPKVYDNVVNRIVHVIIDDKSYEYELAGNQFVPEIIIDEHKYVIATVHDYDCNNREVNGSSISFIASEFVKNHPSEIGIAAIREL